MADDQYWFAARRYGYGSGRPITWQGWVLALIHMAVVLVPFYLLDHRPLLMAVTIFWATVFPMPLYAAKTRGGWRWRWGKDD